MKTTTPTARTKSNEVDDENVTSAEVEEGDFDKLILTRSTLKAQR